MTFIIYAAAGIVLLGLCIFIHELGHLLGGRMVGIKAKVFSLGYGKGFIKKKVGDTTYQVTLIPLGGYCQFYGEDPSEERGDKSYEFLSAHPLKRIVAVVMGPLFNLAFGIILFFMMNMIGYDVKTNKVLIPEQYRSGKYLSPAYAAGVRDGDEIFLINGKKIYGFTDLQTAVIFSDGLPLQISLKRGADELSMEVSPVKNDGSGRYSIGVAPYGEKILVAGLSDGDIAEKGGVLEMDEIVSIDGVKVGRPEEIIEYTRDKAGKEIVLKVNRRGTGMEIPLVPRMQEFIVINELNEKGISANKMSIHPDSLVKHISAGKVSLEGVVPADIDEVRETAARSGKNIVTLNIGGEELKGVLSIEKRGIVGITPVTSPMDKRLEFSFGEGLVHALVEPYRFVVYNLKGMGMLFSGEMKVRENLSGPIRIVKIAGDVAYYEGIASFILLMAKISIILMVMNLLPIPVVDGSHIIFYLVEWIRGKPLNQKLMERIQSAGVIFLIMLGAFVILNDISMLPIVQKLFN